MIHPNELRIGNLVEYDNVYYSVLSICTDYLELDSLSDETDDSHADNVKTILIEPIQLTEDILQRCGFEITEATELNIRHAYNGYLAMNTYLKEDCGYYWLRYYQAGTQPKIKYLHQLQNLYFALTETGLNIQL